jgi:hypothetical protein
MPGFSKPRQFQDHQPWYRVLATQPGMVVRKSNVNVRTFVVLHTNEAVTLDEKQQKSLESLNGYDLIKGFYERKTTSY